jgi:BA14K-like protein
VRRPWKLKLSFLPVGPQAGTLLRLLVRSLHVHFIRYIIIPSPKTKHFQRMNAITKGGNAMRIILAAVGAVGISFMGVAGVSAIPINAASIDSAAGTDSPIAKARTGGAHHFGRYPSCMHLKSYNPDTKTFIGSNGKQHPCVPPKS